MMIKVSVVMTVVGVSMVAYANPMSKPYIPFRTTPFEHPNLVHHEITFDDQTTKTRTLKRFDPTETRDKDQCPLQFSLGISKRVHQSNSEGLGIIQPPIIYPILPSKGPGRQVLYLTQYEHLDLMTPVTTEGEPFAKDIIKEALVQHVEYPMLFESSAFLTSPILRDVNGDGIVDVVVADYDGGIYAMGLQPSGDNSKRYFHKAQVPRLFVRRHWMEALVNETLGVAVTDSIGDEGGEGDEPKDETTPEREGTHDPYHSYFEYTYGSSHEHESLVRGVTANALGLDQKHVETLQERRKRKLSRKTKTTEEEEEEENNNNWEEEEENIGEPEEGRRRLQEVIEEGDHGHQQQEDVAAEGNQEENLIEPEEQNTEGENNNQGESEEGTPSEPEQEGEGQQNTIEEEVNAVGEQPPEGLSEEEAQRQDSASEQVEDAVLTEDGQEEVATPDEEVHIDSEQVEGFENGEKIRGLGDDDDYSYRGGAGDDMYPGGDDYVNPYGEDYGYRHGGGDDDEYPRERYGDDDYPRYDDYYGRYDSERDEYYDEKHYIRISPHILCTPVLVEFPKLYNDNGEVENYLFVAVSYFMDEDEYDGLFSYHRFENTDHGDESEVQRGMYIANAIMVYQFGEYPRWGRQEHLDLSGDHSAPVNTTLVGKIPVHHEKTSMGAFALSSPTVADIDGDGSMEVLMGTSMGIVYVFDARNLYKKDNWPVQFSHGIESRILVEDVHGDTNLEVFVADVGGIIACLDHKANKLWDRNLVSSVTKNPDSSELLASSQMVLGDVDGDGSLDVVIIAKIREAGKHDAHFLFALSASTGKDLPNFPVHIWSVDKDAKSSDYEAEEHVHQKLPAPLLVDLHGDQDFLQSYLGRNGTTWVQPSRSAASTPPQGGNALGLHIVQPIGSDLVVMEGKQFEHRRIGVLRKMTSPFLLLAGSGCIQAISIGDQILSTVQADDVHGTNSLDLVISTASGNIITLDSPAVPFHPLNVWNNGEMRGSTNTFAHGYSASQGIFIHDVSRQFRDIFGVYIPVTFEIFDNRPNIRNEPDKRIYKVEIRSSTSKPLFRKTYASTGTYTERFYIPFGPGYYTVTIFLTTTHGLVYEDTYHLGYNVNYMGGFALLLWLPLVLASITIFLFGRKEGHWDDEDYQPPSGDRGQGILGLPE